MRQTYRIYKTDYNGQPTRRYWKLIYNAALRLGEVIPLENCINIEFEGVEYPNSDNEKTKHDENHIRFIGSLFINKREFKDIIFVHTIRYEPPKFITFYPRSEDEAATENTVEPLITLALKGEAISPDEIANEMYPEFIKNPGINPLVLINRAKNIAKSRADDFRKYAESWKDQAEVAKKRAANLEEEKDQLEAEKKQLEAEVKKLEKERARASARGETVIEEKAKVLASVETDVLLGGNANTVLIFEDGSRKTMKVITWDKDLAVTRKAKSLIGRRVTTTCWDPISEPGKWSKRDYFRNIYEVE